ncbi:MAG: xanthine dehydrogenase accessory factor [Limisphaerales bacterium]|jgi:xanthine dehydrogenase accessory factor
MIHELDHIIQEAFKNTQLGVENVLATVVGLNGTSYRGPGVRMLISAHGALTGTLSGGCIEKEVIRSAQSVFKSGLSKVITYDGRYRLGCEGLLYILIEPIEIDREFIVDWNVQIEQRNSINISSYFIQEAEQTGQFGSVINLIRSHNISPKINLSQSPQLVKYSQTLSPYFKLIIVGAEHDANDLSKMAAQLGWEVHIISSANNPKTSTDFPSAKRVHSATPDSFDFNQLDAHTAVVLMSHNYALDLKYLIRLIKSNPSYIGILGSKTRKENLFNALIEFSEEVELSFIDRIHAPVGLDIGAETPSEIALSILAEILAVTREKHVVKEANPNRIQF